jgi:hypothetical protein
MRETWYVLVDGNVVCPSEVLIDADGFRLIHESGVLVDMKGDVPRTKNIDPVEERAKQELEKQDDDKKEGYRTRQLKAK